MQFSLKTHYYEIITVVLFLFYTLKKLIYVIKLIFTAKFNVTLFYKKCRHMAFMNDSVTPNIEYLFGMIERPSTLL